MKNNKIFAVAALFIGALLLFGCTQPTPQQTPAPTGQATTTPAATPTPAGQTFTDMGYSELLALGKSLECDLSITSEGTTTTGKAYMKGTSARIDTTTTVEGKTVPMSQVFKNEIIYTTVPDKTGVETMFPGQTCDWLSFDPSKLKDMSQYSESEVVETNELDDKTKTQFTCREAFVSDDKFATSNVCDMTALLVGIMGAFGDAFGNMSPTASVETGPAMPTEFTPTQENCMGFSGMDCASLPASMQEMCNQCKDAGLG